VELDHVGLAHQPQPFGRQHDPSMHTVLAHDRAGTRVDALMYVGAFDGECIVTPETLDVDQGGLAITEYHVLKARNWNESIVQTHRAFS